MRFSNPLDITFRGAFLGAFLALAWPGPAMGQEAGQTPAPPAKDEDSSLATLEFEDAPIREVLEVLVARRGLNLILGPEVKGTVTVALREVPWEDALAAILRTHGLDSRLEGSILWVDLPGKFVVPLETRVFPLRHVDAEEVRALLLPLLGPQGKAHVFRRGGAPGDVARVLSLTDEPANLDRLATLIQTLDAEPAAPAILLEGPDEAGRISLDLREVPLDEAMKALTYRLGLSLVIPPGAGGRVTVTLNSVPWERAVEEIVTSQGLAYSLSQGILRVAEPSLLKPVLETRVFRLEHIQAADAEPLVRGVLSPEGKVSVVQTTGQRFGFGAEVTQKRQQESTGTVRSRRLLVTDQPRVLEGVRTLLSQLDEPPKQVVIEVRIVEVRRNVGEDLGIRWNVEGSIRGAGRPHVAPFDLAGDSKYYGSPFPVPPAGAFTFGTISTANFSAVLQALEEDGRAKTLSSPRITTLDGHEASILIGSKFPITVETIDPQTAVRTVSLDHFENIGIQLLVIPQVTRPGTVRIKLHPAVSTLGQLIEGRFPEINTREADTQMLVPENGTAVIGGMMEERSVSSESGVPFLSSIPLLGNLFRWKSTDVANVDLLIFVTPQVLTPDELGGFAPSDLRDAGPDGGDRGREASDE